MKKVMHKNKTIIIAMMAVISTSFINPLSAMDKKSDPPGIEIKYLGFQDRTQYLSSSSIMFKPITIISLSGVNQVLHCIQKKYQAKTFHAGIVSIQKR